jgi:Fe-S-cluster containining protein
MSGWPPHWNAEDQLTAASPFSYRCGRCGNCCRDKLIQVSPYEVGLLAEFLGISTTLLIRDYLDGVHLRRQENGNCIFFGEHGCTVHDARPEVCRLYPLGHRISAEGHESFVHLVPHSATQGTYGESGTVAQWLEHQDVDRVRRGCDSYAALFQQLLDSMADKAGNQEEMIDWMVPPKNFSFHELLDIDAMLARYSKQIPETLDRRVARHQELLRELFM